MRKELNSQRIGLGHQHGYRFIVLGHQYGRRDVMWKHSIVPHLFFFFSISVLRPALPADLHTDPWNYSIKSDPSSDHHIWISQQIIVRPDHQIRPSAQTTTVKPDNQFRSDHPTRSQTTILDSSASKQHSITNILKWYRSGAFLMGWVKGVI